MIRENILKIKERIPSICSKVGRDPHSVNIVAVSKGRGVEEIKGAIEAGIIDIGENKVQEALVKYKQLSPPEADPPRIVAEAIKWHMVGHLQTNKAREAVKIFDLIHSVDSMHLAREIDKEAAKIDKVQDILIEVKTSPEATKFGLKPDEVIETVKEISQLKHINIKGLMTIAPMVDNPENARLYFCMLREIRDKINSSYLLSMGMTDDFEVAIEEGSDMIRLGRAIFD